MNMLLAYSTLKSQHWQHGCSGKATTNQYLNVPEVYSRYMYDVPRPMQYYELRVLRELMLMLVTAT